MQAYKRNIQSKLLLLRLVLWIALPLCVLLFQAGYSKSGYVLAVALISLSPLSITGLVFTDSKIQVTRYFLFGLVPVQWSFINRDLYEIKSLEGQASEIMPLMVYGGSCSPCFSHWREHGGVLCWSIREETEVRGLFVLAYLKQNISNLLCIKNWRLCKANNNI